MRKQLLGNPFFQFVVGRLIGLYMLLAGVTTRWTRVNRAAVEPFWRGEGKLIICIWHGRFALLHKLWAFWPGAPKATMLISQSREGGIIAHMAHTVGADVIRGSAAKRGQQKGGAQAMFAMSAHISNGGVIAITPDGPRGPRMRANRGAVQLAKLAQAHLMPLAWSTNHRRVLQSWDRFILPLPFGKGALIWGDPIAPPALDADEAAIENVRLKFEHELNRICAEADRIAGVAAIEPAPLKADAPPARTTAASDT